MCVITNFFIRFSSRSIFLAEVVGGKLSPSRMVVVRFLECEATLQGIIGKVQDAIGSHDPIVLTDAQGNAILDSEGTTGGKHFLKLYFCNLTLEET